MKIHLNNPIHLLATGFGAGLLRPAPGTWGSLVGLCIAIFLWNLTASPLFFLLLSVVSFILGCSICHKTGQDIGIHDDGRIVWDEMVAIWLIFCVLPAYNWIYYGLTFALFRLFDVWKPYPIRMVDQRLTGGIGVMTDDILAALYTLVALHLIAWMM